VLHTTHYIRGDYFNEAGRERTLQVFENRKRSSEGILMYAKHNFFIFYAHHVMKLCNEFYMLVAVALQHG
jgi:hypothetical protein